MILAADLHFGANEQRVMDSLKELVIGDPDRLLIIPGDLTQDAKQDEYGPASELLMELLERGIKVVLTPGNHDFGNGPGEHLGWRKRVRERYAALLDLISKQPGMKRFEYDMVLATDSDVFVSLRSTHTRLLGPDRIRGEQIAWARGILDALPTAGCRLHLITHRSLWPGKHPPMRRKTRLEAELLGPYRFYSFINGHNHLFDYDEARSTPKLNIKCHRGLQRGGGCLPRNATANSGPSGARLRVSCFANPSWPRRSVRAGPRSYPGLGACTRMCSPTRPGRTV